MHYRRGDWLRWIWHTTWAKNNSEPAGMCSFLCLDCRSTFLDVEQEEPEMHAQKFKLKEEKTWSCSVRQQGMWYLKYDYKSSLWKKFWIGINWFCFVSSGLFKMRIQLTVQICISLSFWPLLGHLLHCDTLMSYCWWSMVSLSGLSGSTLSGSSEWQKRKKNQMWWRPLHKVLSECNQGMLWVCF